MLDFFKIKTRPGKTKGSVNVYPDFRVCKTKDLLIKGNSFHAVWNEETGLWSTSEEDVQRLVDDELWKYKEEKVADGSIPETAKVLSLESYSSGMWTVFVKYLREMPNTSVDLDTKLTFADTKTTRKDYASKRLGYSLNDGSYEAWDEIVGTLYSPSERTKIEWCIGSIVSGDSIDIQKFAVFYGSAGAGKSTILNVIQKLFAGYYVVFDAKELTSANNQFATEMFRTNPLVAIQHDGDLSRIEDNTKLNSIVSHEEIVINEKRKTKYVLRPRCFLFMATNRPVKITDSKSGVIRRLIDIRPTGVKIPIRRYNALMAQIDFELGAIAKHCLDVYREKGKNYYDDYKPHQMQEQTDVFYNFVENYIDEFMRQDSTTLSQAYDMYKKYCDEASVPWKMEKYKFKEELKSYFKEFKDDVKIDGRHVRNIYSGFILSNFIDPDKEPEPEEPIRLVLDQDVSLLDDILADCPAQYATNDESERPLEKWSDVRTKLSDLDTTKVHYVKVPQNHIVIDFDLKDENGNKDMQKNLEAASKWPPTYAEFSKGGNGIHLHYIYTGDVSKLSMLYDDGIEVKVYKGNAALRRRVSKCNNIPVAMIDSGLPLKEEKMINADSVKSEVALRKLIERNLKKEIHPGTKPSIDFIYKILEDAYNSGLAYDVSDMRSRVFRFAMGSTHQAEYCSKLVKKMKFKSQEEIAPGIYISSSESDDRLVFFDIEVFPNLLLVNWKYEGKDSSVVRMVNPSPQDIEQLMKMKLVGFNCRKYDNHILYARYLGETNWQLYDRSRRIISGDSTAFFGEAYNISYTDVYDFSSKKQSLKKFEIELGIHHQELGLPWDEPVPEELWEKVAEYCDNDVIATEVVFNARHADFVAREILASVAGMTVNDTTNSLTTRIIFGGDRKPQSQFNYRDMGDESDVVEIAPGISVTVEKAYTKFDSKGRPIFPGYSYSGGKSIYRGEEVGEGGYVYAEPGIYTDVALLDIASMHPSSIVAEQLFGPVYTARFQDILQARIYIKHGDFDKARELLDGKLAPYLTDVGAASDLAQALKIAINSVYGLTSAKFDNPFRDLRNKDNIVAKRGALFMVNLKHEVQARGFTVAHIKTDSIKIPNATPEIIRFVMDYGKLYGYNFEHEATYDRMCLVNDAVYIAKYKGGKHDGEWTATGAEFQHPYIFKTLFSKEPISFSDLCETKTVTSSLYLDMNEGLEEGEHDYRFIGKAGLFTPIKPGCGGGVLLREKDGKYYAATGSKGYRWLESEAVQALGKESDVDIGYFRKLVDDAVDHIREFGDFDDFVNGHGESRGDYVVPCGDGKYNSCFDCTSYDGHDCKRGWTPDVRVERR